MSLAVTANRNDKLVTALFVTGLLHGVLILGVSFDFLAPPEFLGSPSLEVILVQDPKQSDLTPDDAHYLSEQNQSGDGTTLEKVRAESRMSNNTPLANAGTDTGTALSQNPAPSENDVSLIVSRNLSDFSRASLREREESQEEAAEAMLMRESEIAPDLVSEFDDNTQIHSTELRELFVSVNTKKTDLARYLVLWKRKIEQVGTLNFPNESLLEGLSGNPTLEVAISSSGFLEDVVLRQSSGEPRVDQAAMNIVRLASPFEAFPPNLQAKYDVMRFVYIWQFVDGQSTDSSVKLPES
ncbi:MAG: TonB family protein [Gammaproteobacteria bacterium]